MCCSVCSEHRTNPAVRGTGNALNALCTGTTRYMLDTIKNHENSFCHQNALRLSNQQGSNLDVRTCLKTEDAEQVFKFFMAVYSLLKRSAPLHQIRDEIQLIKACGCKYDLTYRDSMAAKEASSFIAAQVVFDF